MFAVYSTEEMSSEPTESQITVVGFEALSDDQAETSLLNFEDEKSSEANIQLDYTKRVLNDTNNETHQIRTVATNNAIKTLKHALEGNESNREKKKKSVNRKERAHCPDTSRTIPLSQQSKFINSGCTTPSPHSPALNYSLVEPPMLVDRINNPFIEKDEVDDILVIDDVDDLYFMDGDPADDYKIEEINVSQLFRKYQNNSINISKTEGLFVESNIHEILSLSSIFLLIPDSHSRKMIDIFGSPLLDKIHQRIIPTQQTALDAECEAKFGDAIKRVTKESFSHATDWLMAELSNNKHLKDNMGFIILDCLRTLPFTKIKNDPSEMTLVTNYLDRIMRGMLHDPNRHIIEWPNTGLDESKARKYAVSYLWAKLFRCRHRKGCGLEGLRFSVCRVQDGFLCDGPHPWNVYDDPYRQVYIPSSIKEMNLFVNEVETLLKVRKIFCKSFDTLYSKLCNPSPPSPKTIFKRNTLGTPKFNELVNKTRNCHRDCPMCQRPEYSMC
ncbi:hypothetical protein GLOIN_2v1774982 [Rhizophagus clarus]|uniref:Uncharacterized protein n=1 Tax=Rhizophagus clarus TaxID=94130 RepID=A0A8H3L356_9GLOM|nr:hypothetical protein GLOIN_2v1774982 [Rhizophagus clarus]